MQLAGLQNRGFYVLTILEQHSFLRKNWHIIWQQIYSWLWQVHFNEAVGLFRNLLSRKLTQHRNMLGSSTHLKSGLRTEHKERCCFFSLRMTSNPQPSPTWDTQGENPNVSKHPTLVTKIRWRRGKRTEHFTGWLSDKCNNDSPNGITILCMNKKLSWKGNDLKCSCIYKEYRCAITYLYRLSAWSLITPTDNTGTPYTALQGNS